MSTDHVYVNGERKSPTEVGGYIHVGPNGKTLGPNMDIELALAYGYTAGLTFVSLNNGDVAVIGTDPQATMEACEGDVAFKAAGEALIEEAMAKARADKMAEIMADMGDNPLAGLLKTLMESRGNSQNMPSPRDLPRRGGGSSFADFLAQLGSSEDCQCDDCKRDRGEL